MRIHYDNNKLRIKIDNFNEVDQIKNLHGRRWQPGAKTWAVPVCRENIERIDNFARINPKTSYSDAAIRLIKEWQKSNQSTVFQEFPDDYVFKTEPRPYQTKGMLKLWPKYHSALFMDPGTGKTKIAIDTATARFMLNQIQQVIVIALVSIKSNWEEEIIKHCPLYTSIHIMHTGSKGEKELRKFKASDERFKWIVLGVESLSTGAAFGMVQSILDQPTMIIMDESSKIKSHKAKRTERTIELGANPNVKARMILTGTPVTQGIEDLFAQFSFLDENIIGIPNYYAYRNSYCVMGGFNDKKIVAYKNVPKLVKILDPYVFQARKREVLTDLPEFTRQVRKVEMTPEQKKLYSDLKKNFKLEIGDNKLTVLNAMNLLQRFVEITGGHISYEVENKDPLTKAKKPFVFERKRLKKAPKIDELLNILEEMPADEQVIVWASRISEIHWIAERLREVYGKDSVGVLIGDVSEDGRTKIRTDFQNNKLKFIVGNPSVGGIGLNLTASRYIINYSRSFSLEIAIQSDARIDRIGQKRAITYYDIVCEKTIDEQILKSLSKKEDFSNVFRNAFTNNLASVIDLL